MMEPEDLPDFEDQVDRKEMGLYPKYDVIRRSSGELVTEPVFVMNPRTDPHARAALRGYAEDVGEDGHEALARDIYEWIDAVEAVERARADRDAEGEARITQKLDDLDRQSRGL